MFYEYAFKETYNLKGKDTILEARRAFVDKWPQELKKKDTWMQSMQWRVVFIQLGPSLTLTTTSSVEDPICAACALVSSQVPQLIL